MDPASTAVFFYGLFMDAELLRGRGVRVSGARVARLENFRLSIGARATLIPAPGRTVYGILMWAPAEDLDRLCSDPSVSAYRPETVTVISSTGAGVEALCYNLAPSLHEFKLNQAYAQQLQRLAATLGLPPDYLAQIERAGQDSK